MLVQPKNNLLLQTSRAHVWEPRATGHTRRTSHALSPQAEVVTEKEPVSDPPADLGDPAREMGGNRGLPWG